MKTAPMGRSLWWEEYRYFYFELASLTTGQIEALDPVFTDGKHSFYDSEIKTEYGCIEEQLYAIRNKLA